jgi:hypothetical protein
MKFSKGYIVPKAVEINEEFEIRDKYIIANVSFDNLKKVLLDFIELLEEPLFFILELPLNKQEEEELRKSDLDPFHKAIYYIDGCSKQDLNYIIEKSGDLLINDGLSNFGFASHNTHTEIMVMKYNVVYIFTEDLEKCSKLFLQYGINQVNKIKTAWQTFTKDSYGEAKTINIKGKTVYSIIDDYKEWNIYRSEIREEK